MPERNKQLKVHLCLAILVEIIYIGDGAVVRFPIAGSGPLCFFSMLIRGVTRMPDYKNTRHQRFAKLVSVGNSLAEAAVACGYRPTYGACLAHKLGLDRNIPEVDKTSPHDVVETREDNTKTVEDDLPVAAQCDRDWILPRLMINADRALAVRPGRDGDYVWQGAVANRALELLGKEIGLFGATIPEDNNPFRNLSDEELDARIRKLVTEIGTGTGADRTPAPHL